MYALVYCLRSALLNSRVQVFNVAKAYGFEKACTIDQLAKDDPSRYPFFDYPHEPLVNGANNIAAVFVMHDPIRKSVCSRTYPPYQPVTRTRLGS